MEIAEKCFDLYSFDFNNILKLYGLNLKKCIDDESDTISNIFAIFLLQNNYLRDTVTMITETIKQCVNSNVTSKSSAGIRTIAASCLSKV